MGENIEFSVINKNSLNANEVYNEIRCKIYSYIFSKMKRNIAILWNYAYV